jgi:hypothetical protein
MKIKGVKDLLGRTQVGNENGNILARLALRIIARRSGEQCSVRKEFRREPFCNS